MQGHPDKCVNIKHLVGIVLSSDTPLKSSWPAESKSAGDYEKITTCNLSVSPSCTTQSFVKFDSDDVTLIHE